MATKINIEYQTAKTVRSDINEHIEIFSKLAKECSTITEMGIRTVVSSWGFLHGLVNNKSVNKILVGVDLNYHNNIDKLREVCSEVNVSYKFIQGNSAKIDLDNTDLLFIDTWHIYGHLKRELAKHHTKVTKYIVLHDTTVDEFVGESIRCNFNIKQQVIDSGYSEDEIRKGLWPAVEEFLNEHTEWKLKTRYTNNNGLTILERIKY